MKNARVRIGIIGGGMMCQVGHLPFYLTDPRCEVVGVAESRPSLIDALKDQHGMANVPAEHRALLDDPTIDAVVISVPRAASGPLTLEALEAGKHVMVEKPMAHTAKQADRLAELARESGLTYAVGFMKRYDPGIAEAKRRYDEIKASARLGRLVLGRFYDFANGYAVSPPPHKRPEESRPARLPVWPLWPDWLPERYRATYAWFVNHASHDVNLLRHFLGDELEVVSAFSPSSDAVVATLVAGDAPIELQVAKCSNGAWLQGAEFLFEKGRLAIEVPSPMAVDRVSRVTLDENLEKPQSRILKTGAGWAFARQAEGFLDALTGLALPLTTGEDGYRDMVLCEEIWKRISRHGDD